MTAPHQSLLGTSGAVAEEETDAEFNQTVLLLHGDGTNGGQNNTFVDSSTSNHTITRNGNTTQGTFSPFSLEDGYWSVFFDGSGDYLTFGDNLDIVANNFTFECFVYFTQINNTYNSIFSKYGASYSYQFLWDAPNNRWFWNVNNGASTTVTFSDTIVTGQWYYLCLERTGTSYKVYRDGSQIDTTKTIAGSIADGTRPFALGTTFDGSGNAVYPLVGYISNFRAEIGSNVYGSVPSVPSEPLTAISGTSLLTCQSNRFVDNSSNEYAITIVGNSSVQPFSPFAPTRSYSESAIGGSGYFDGSGDYLSVAHSGSLQISTNPFIIEAWVYPTECSGNESIVASGPGAATNHWLLWLANGEPKWVIYTSSSPTHLLNSGVTLPKNAWAHILVSRDSSNNHRLYVNGVQKATTVNSAPPGTTSDVTIGAQGSANVFQGYIAGVRMDLGVSQDSNFTIPSAPKTATGNDLLVNFTNASIIDSTMKNNGETIADTQLDTTVKKFGTASMEFDGTGDYVRFHNNPLFTFGVGDFTIECFVYFNNTSGTQYICGQSHSDYASGTAFQIYLASNTIYGWLGSGAAYEVTASVFSATTWVHLAFVRQGANIRLYFDGVQQDSSSVGATYSPTISTGPFSIGTVGNYASGNLNAFIDEFRITKGTCRYPDGTTFTPPTKAFANK